MKFFPSPLKRRFLGEVAMNAVGGGERTARGGRGPSAAPPPGGTRPSSSRSKPLRGETVSASCPPLYTHPGNLGRSRLGKAGQVWAAQQGCSCPSGYLMLPLLLERVVCAGLGQQVCGRGRCLAFLPLLAGAQLINLVPGGRAGPAVVRQERT